MSSRQPVANQNRPLWQRVTFALADGTRQIGELSEVEREALWGKAVSTMKPDPEEMRLLVDDEAAREAYMLKFVAAYQAGMPPLSGLVEHRLPPSSD